MRRIMDTMTAMKRMFNGRFVRITMIRVMLVLAVIMLIFSVSRTGMLEVFAQTDKNAPAAVKAGQETAGAAQEADKTVKTGEADTQAVNDDNKAGGKEDDAGSGEEVAKSDEAQNSHLAEAGQFKIGKDWTVWVLIILFIFAIAVAVERSIYIYRNRGDNADLVDQVLAGLASNSEDPSALIEKVSEEKYGMEGRIVAKTLRGWKFGVAAMGEFATAATEAETRSLEKRLVVLSTLGNNTPFIGLLGTVLGIMKAFRDLALMGDAGPAVVMKGISEALIATAFGLGVAIPCVIAFNVLSKMVKSKLSNSGEIVKIIQGIRSAFELQGSAGVVSYTSKAAVKPAPEIATGREPVTAE